MSHLVDKNQKQQNNKLGSFFLTIGAAESICCHLLVEVVFHFKKGKDFYRFCCGFKNPQQI